MLVSTLEETLRRVIHQRIDAGELTGSALARQTGFRQAHISNFLNRRRGLSVEGMDSLLSALDLSVDDLVSIDGKVRSSRRAISGEYEDIPVVSCTDATTQPAIVERHVRDVLKFKKAFLRRLRPDTVGKQRLEWGRYVIIKAEPDDAAAMYPRITAGATLLVDRHYNSLTPYRRGEANIYAVRKGNSCLVRYVALQGKQLSLRPANHDAPLDFVAIESSRSATDYIVGRVCHVGMEV